MNNKKTDTYTHHTENGETQNTFTYFTDIPVSEKVSFIKFVTDSVITDNDYFSILRNLIFDYAIIVYFTDIDDTEISQSKDKLSSIENFLKNTDVINLVKAGIDEAVLKELNQAVDKNIKYHTTAHRDSFSDILTGLLKTAEEKIASIDTASVMSLANSLSGLSDNLSVDKFKDVIDKYE